MIRTSRLALAASAAVLVLCGSRADAALPAPVLAVAPPQAASAGFATPVVLSTAGTAMSFVNTDLTGHTVTSKETRPVRVRYGTKYYTIRVPLFDSGGVGSGAKADVRGVAKLKPGTYHFYCALHTSMTGQLQVK
jgi:plastocyanin